MNKRVKWGIIIVIGAGLIGGGIYSQLPKENEYSGKIYDGYGME